MNRISTHGLSELLPKEYVEAICSISNSIVNTLQGVDLLVLSGSCGRGDVIPGLSDIDFFVVVNSLLEQQAEFKQQNRYYNGIKVGYTYSTVSILKSQFRSPKETYFLYYTCSGRFPVLYGEVDQLPYVKKNDVVLHQQRSISEYIEEISCDFSSTSTMKELCTVVKHIHTIMKRLLLARGKFVEGYDAVREAFYAEFSSKHPPLVSHPKILRNLSYEDVSIESRHYLSWAKSVMK